MASRAPSMVLLGAVFVVALQFTVPAGVASHDPTSLAAVHRTSASPAASAPGLIPGAVASITRLTPVVPHPAAGGAINLSREYSHEPAPMGVADYGVDAAGTASVVATPVLLGIATLGKTITWNASLVSPGNVNLELGGNLEFVVGGVTYVYWVQNVIQYGTRGGNAAFFDDAWNASSPTAQMRAGSITGLGTVLSSAAGEYYDCPANSSLPGNGYFIPLPAELEVEMTAVAVGGAPGVSFAFNDGFGWLTYDTLSFPFGKGANDSGFVIDGFDYRPDGKFFDAEYALGGPTIGTQTRANESNLDLELEYWNGHNLQEPPTAYNFASDSSESIGNIRAIWVTGPMNGTLLANVTAAAGGSLGVLWNRSNVGEVNLSTSVPNGELYVNGAPAGGFAGGAANLTLSPGNYTIAVYNLSLLEGQASVAVPSGSYRYLHIAWQDVYTVTFQEAGLPPDTPWSVVVDNVSLGGAALAIGCLLPGGAHDFRVAPLAGFVATPASGSLPISTTNVTVEINWTVQTFTLAFVPHGLPPTATWTVTVNGEAASSLGGTISFPEVSGTYAYAVTRVPGFRASPSIGSVEVPGRNQTVDVAWTAYTYPVLFAASGLPVGQAWSLAVESAGVWLNSTGTDPVVGLPLANGSFSYVVGAPPGYVAATPTGHDVVNGSGFTVPLVFRGANGFFAGTIRPVSAAVWVDNASVPVSNGTFNVSVTPGPHDVRASAPGYSTIEMVLVALSDQVTPVEWNLTATAASSDWTTSYLAYAVGGGVAVAALALAFWFSRRPPRLRVVEAEVIDDRPAG